MSGATPEQLNELKRALTSYNSAAKELAEKKPIIDNLGVEQAMQSVGGVVDGAGHTHTVLGSYSTQLGSGSGSSVINNSTDPTKTAYDTFVDNFIADNNALTTALSGSTPPFDAEPFTSDTAASNAITTAVEQTKVETAIKNVEKDKIQENLENIYTVTLGGKKRTRKARKARKAKKSKKSKKRLPSKKRKARKSMRKH